MRRLLVVLGVICGCSSEPSQRIDTITDSSSMSGSQPLAANAPGAVQWMFEPRTGERDSLARTLTVLANQLQPDEASIVGELYRFGATTEGARYLLVATQPPVDAGLNQRLVLYVVTPAGALPASSPHDTGIEDLPNRFADAAIRDFDRDGLDDFAYCHWAARGQRQFTTGDRRISRRIVVSRCSG